MAGNAAIMIPIANNHFPIPFSSLPFLFAKHNHLMGSGLHRYAIMSGGSRSRLLVCMSCIHLSDVMVSGCGKSTMLPIAGMLSRNVHPNHCMHFTHPFVCWYFPFSAIVVLGMLLVLLSFCFRLQRYYYLLNNASLS